MYPSMKMIYEEDPVVDQETGEIIHLDEGDGEKPFFEYCDKMEALYVSLKKKFVLMRFGETPFIPKNANGIYQKLTGRVMSLHFMRKIAVNVFAGVNLTKFLCFDVDEGGKESVRQLVSKLEELGVKEESIAVSYSGGKGFHVDVFFEPLVKIRDTAVLYNRVCKECGFNQDKVEFRPTGIMAIKLPLSRHYKTGNMCWYLDKKTLEPVHSYDCIFSFAPMSGTWLDEFAEANRDEYPDTEVKALSGKTYAVPAFDAFLEEHLHEVSSKERKQGDMFSAESLCSGHFAMDFTSKRIIVDSSKWPKLRDSGLTHKTMTAIAVHERIQGMERDDLEKGLEDWWHEQEEKYITDNWSFAGRDIKEICDWVYGPKFHAPSSEKKIVFTQDTIKWILSCKGKAARRVMFLSYILCERSNFFRLSLEGIGKIVDCTEKHIYTSVFPQLVEAGLIEKVSGKSGVSDCGFYREANKYFLTDKSTGQFFTKDTDLQQKFEKTVFLKDQIILPVKVYLTKENFDSFYYGVLSSMIKETSLGYIWLSRAEYARMKELLAKERKEEEENGN